MKKLLFVLLFFLFAIQVISQSKSNSLTLNTGVFIPGVELDNFNVGWNLGTEFQNYSKPWAFFAEFNVNIAKRQEYLYYPELNPYTKSFIELTVGPRYYIDIKRVHPFIDLGAGIYIIDYSRNSAHLGISTGIGTVININKDFDIMIKGKYHPHLVVGDGAEIVDYFGIYGGIKYNF